MMVIKAKDGKHLQRHHYSAMQGLSDFLIRLRTTRNLMVKLLSVQWSGQ
jgi:hypothetical protein